MKGKNKRRFNKFISIGLIVTLAVSFCVSISQSPIVSDIIFSSLAAEASSDEITFEFDLKENSLTLSGNAEMPDYTQQEPAPWNEFRASAEKIVIDDGIKSVGDNAFVSFSDLGEVTIPQSVSKISDNAFVDCKEDFVIRGVKDSAADTFAQLNQYKFEETASDTSVQASETPTDPTIPVNVTVTCEAYNKLKISWSRVENAAGYYLYFATSENGKYSTVKQISNGDITEYVHSSRSYEKVYYYKVRSYQIINSQKVLSPDSEVVSGRTHVDPPARVENVTVKCTAYNKLAISWDQVDDAAGYYVYCATAADGKYRLSKNITRNTTTQYVHSGCTYEKTYYYKVCAYTKAGSKAICAESSEIVSGRTHIDPPARAENVTVKCTAYNKLAISWDKVDDAAGYYVYCATAADGKYSLTKNITRNTTTQYVHSGRGLGKTYYYKVLAYTKAGSKAICAESSEIVSGTTYLHTPSAPTLTAKADGTIYVSFTKVSGAYKYNLYRSIDGGEYSFAATIWGNYLDKNTVPGKTYSYKLAAVRSSIVTEYSNAAECTCSLSAPNASSAASASYDSIKVNWKKVSNASEYKIYRSTVEDGDYTCIGTVNSRTYSFTAGDLVTGTRYYFKVTAGKKVGDDVGYSNMSNAVSAVPSLASVKKISGSSVGRSAIFVEWTKLAGADGYELYAARSGESMEFIAECDKYYYSHKELTAGKKYTYKVRAYRTVNGEKIYSDFSKTASVTVPKSLSKTTYSWSYSYKVENHETPEALIKAQEKASNINTLFVGDTERKVIYLTMDCGYPSENSDKNLDTLKEKNVKATFFIALPYAKGSHSQLQRMIDEGHILGNHTKSHFRLTKASAATIKNEVKTTENYIYDNFNYRTTYFRYPYGSFSQASQDELINMGYISAGWSFAYNDFSKKQPNKTYALNLITQSIHPGAIFLLHMDSDTNTAILGDFIDTAREMGYEFENLDDISF